jgi:rRNA biogenesis protein RRP5
MMAKKRVLEDAQVKKQVKRPRREQFDPKPVSLLQQDDLDFPRGGGTSFTALEVKAIQAEGRKEADNDLFQVRFIFYIIFGLPDTIWHT